MSPSGLRQERAGRQFAGRPREFPGLDAKALLLATSRDRKQDSIAESTTLNSDAWPGNRGAAAVCLRANRLAQPASRESLPDPPFFERSNDADCRT